jgi:hypothetical protein
MKGASAESVVINPCVGSHATDNYHKIPCMCKNHSSAKSFQIRSSTSMTIPSRVKLVDVGPRDGLQNEKQTVPASGHQNRVGAPPPTAGLTEIEVTSFVSPKWVPQMADNAEVMAGIQRQAGVRYSVLTPNMQGYQAAVQTKPDDIVVFAAASEAFVAKHQLQH